MNKTGKCRGCGADIMFIKTRNGKTMPVDAQSMYFVPDLNGKALYVLPDGTVAHGVPGTPEDPDRHIGYISHFATCPAADSFRKPRKKDRKGA